MDADSAFWYLKEIEDDFILAMLSEWNKARGDPNARQAWSVIPAKMLIKEWQYNQKTGLVHEKVIEKIEKICIDNYCKLYINNVIFGHSQLSPFGYLEMYINEEWGEEELEAYLEDYEWFACDEKGRWRISDYGVDKIGSLVLDLIAEEDYCKKLFYIDQILNVTHQRSDLASWFVEGGSATLSWLSD